MKILGSCIAFLPAVSTFLEGADLETLSRYGLLGLVLAWFMVKADGRLAKIEHRLGGLSRTQLIEIMSRSTTTPHVRRIALQELRRSDPSTAVEWEQTNGFGE